jgi:hypothetical protein
MRQCCEKVKNHPNIGQSCGKIAEKTTSRKTCSTILTTIRDMYRDSNRKLPEICHSKDRE